jgi:thymidylate synthase
MNNLDKKYTDLLQDILENGTKKETRNGGTISVFGRQIRHKMSEAFPVITTKKMAWKTMVTELIWFLRGGTNIKFLVDNGCHIWDGDAYKNYEKGILRQRELQKKEVERLRNSGKRLKVSLIELLPKEEFINKIKTNDEFANKWGELGPVYGAGWRNWGGKSDDKLYEDYLKKVKEK